MNEAQVARDAGLMQQLHCAVFVMPFHAFPLCPLALVYIIDTVYGCPELHCPLATLNCNLLCTPTSQEVCIPGCGLNPSAFMDTATKFVNEKCFGSLTAGVFIHPETQKDNEASSTGYVIACASASVLL